VARWVKNDRLVFFIPYRNRGVPARYVPDFIVVMDNGMNIVVEIKGQVTDSADAKAKAAERWCSAVSKLGQYGQWRYLLVTDPSRMAELLNQFAEAQWSEGPFALT
jgi:type III restriction enzyme